MSIRIPHGFLLQESEFAKIHEMVSGWRSELRELQRAGVARLLADRASFLIDDLDCGGAIGQRRVGEIPLSVAWREFAERRAEIASSRRRDPQVDFDFEMTLHPFKGRVYGIAFSEQSDWLAAWMQKPGVEPFAYWDHTDPDEGLSRAEWRRRGRIWSAILDRNGGTPAMSGFTAQCTPPHAPYPKPDEVVRQVASFEDRLNRVASEMVFSRRFAARLATEQGADEGGPRPDQEAASIMSSYIDARRWMRDDDEGRMALDDEKRRAREILRTEIDISDLTAPLGSPVAASPPAP